jgi:hypothetical protein
MNRLLSKVVAWLNGFCALLLILAGVLIGVGLSEEMGGGVIVLGFIGGLVAAVLINGIIAIFISMRDELINIKQILDQTPEEKKNVEY